MKNILLACGSGIATSTVVHKKIADILDENVPIDEILKVIPAGRMGDPEEVAHAVDFLMDEKAAYITRQVIAVNGGLC